MFLRLVHLKIQPDRLSEIKTVYGSKVIPTLRAMKGCLSGNLIYSDHNPDECISMTLWEKKADADSYERSGVFQQLLDEVRPFLADSCEWKIQLSEDFKVEYQPLQEEPVVKAYDLSVDSTMQVLGRPDRSLYVRIVSPHVRGAAREEFRKIYNEEVLPQLRGASGCRYATLTENIQSEDQFVSMTVWDSKADADAYETSGLFQKLTKRLQHTFSEAYQWKMHLEHETGRKTVSTDDVEVKGYSVVSGQTFS